MNGDQNGKHPVSEPLDLSEFVDWLPARKAAFLSHLIGLETLHIRAAHSAPTPDLPAIIAANERIHRLNGHVTGLIEGGGICNAAAFASELAAEIATWPESSRVQARRLLQNQ